MIRGAYGTLVNWKEEEREEAELGGRTSEEKGKDAFVASAGAVVIGALVLRFGGRAALVSVLGLDVVADLGIGDAIDDVVAYADALGPLAVVGFFAAWTVAKVFLIDFISIALAFSSGILFGGVFPGALLATTGATLGSLAAFQLSRGIAEPRVSKAVESQPVARALAKVVEEDGFKTVFVLRLAPIVPIPLGAYSYIYGASKLNALPFAAATFLGGVKPYLIDSYLGVFTKQIIDGDAMDSSKDLILLVGLGVLVLVGVFATDLAAESWDEVQKEIKADEAKRKAEGKDEEEVDAEPFSVGPINVDELRGKVVAMVPSSWKAEAKEVWETLDSFAQYQWKPAAKLAIEGRRRRAEEEEAGKAPVAGADSENPVMRFLASMATPAEEGADGAAGGGAAGGGAAGSGGTPGSKAQAEAAHSDNAAGAGTTVGGAADGAGDGAAGASAAGFFYGEDEATPEDMAERERCAAWSLDGGLGRIALTSLFFTFALANAAKGKWAEYPETVEELESLLGIQAAAGAGEAAAGAGAAAASVAAASAGSAVEP